MDAGAWCLSGWEFRTFPTGRGQAQGPRTTSTSAPCPYIFRSLAIKIPRVPLVVLEAPPVLVLHCCMGRKLASFCAENS